MNTLKTLTSAAVLVSALAGAASATTVNINGVDHTDDNTVRWSGTTPVFASRCDFSGAADQDMNFDEASNTWTVDSTTDAVITVTMRDVEGIFLEPVDSKLYKSDGTEIGAVTVDYKTSTKVGTPGTMSNPNGTDLITVNGFGTNTTEIFTLNLDGTATMRNIDSITNGIQENTSYYVRHKVTCLQ